MSNTLKQQNEKMKAAIQTVLACLEERSLARCNRSGPVEDGLTAFEAKEYRMLRSVQAECEKLSSTPALKLDNEHMNMYMCSMGKLFRVTHICDSADDANRTMLLNQNTALIAEDSAGHLFLAKQYGAVAPSAILEDMKRD